jgi:hypothetical protein
MIDAAREMVFNATSCGKGEKQFASFIEEGLKEAGEHQIHREFPFL